VSWVRGRDSKFLFVAVLIAVDLLLWCLIPFTLKGSAVEEAQIFRLTFLLFAFVMMVTSRFLMVFLRRMVRDRRAREVLDYPLLLPTLLVPLLGLYLSLLTKEWWDYGIFFLLGIFHALRLSS
jgi:hypothetical protein